ncbi:MAG: serine/threonine-protein kinase, partial [Aquihabitans sp.]
MSGAKGPPPDLPGFTFTEGIGGGGFADVFLFTQHSTGRPVAVKVLRLEHLSESSLQQFQVEANVMAGVSAHPYIVTIHDAGVAPDGRPFIVMEHYPQPHFGIRSRGGNLGLAEVLKVGVQIACAVETAHRANIIHRDIKPANILTSTFGDPGLTDFGIAGVQADEGGLTAAGGVSLGYAAPEVVLDENATGSRQSDVYSLAATLYALLSGRSPVYIPGADNSEVSVTRRIANGAIQPLRREDVPRSFQHLLNSALASTPEHRPTSAVALAQPLQDVEQELRLAATPLVLVGATPAVGPVDRSDDTQGTRRKPQVVRVEGPAPAIAAPPGFAAPVAPPTPPQPAPVAPLAEPATAPRAGRPGAEAGLDTVARPGRPVDPSDPTPIVTEAPAPASEPKSARPLLIVAAVVVVLLVAIAGFVAFSGGGGGGGESSETTEVRSTPQDPTGGAAFINAPTNVKASLAAD